jgi:hypothetical protein
MGDSQLSFCHFERSEEPVQQGSAKLVPFDLLRAGFGFAQDGKA